MSAFPDCSEEEIIPISAISHHLYCPRQNALIHVEGVFRDNELTVAGNIGHEFVDEERSVYHFSDPARKKIITFYQEQKSEEIQFPLLNIKIRRGHLPFYQARVLARVFRGELKEYQPFIRK